MSSYDQTYNPCCGMHTDPLQECKCETEKREREEEEMRHAQWLAAEKIRQQRSRDV